MHGRKNNWWLIWTTRIMQRRCWQVQKGQLMINQQKYNSDKMEWIQKWLWFLEAFSTKVRLQVQERGHRVEGRREQVKSGDFTHICSYLKKLQLQVLLEKFLCHKSVSQCVRESTRQDEAAGRVESSSPCRAGQAGEGLYLFFPFVLLLA